jgi:LIM domain kinase 1
VPKIFFAIFRLEENPDLMSLHIGDRVIDINGHSIDNSQSITDLQKLIDETRSVLQLTLEHEPNTIARKNPVSGELEFLMAPNVSRNPSSSTISPTSDSISLPPIPKLDKARIAMRMDEGYMSGTPKKSNKLSRNQKYFIICLFLFESIKLETFLALLNASNPNLTASNHQTL